MLKGRRSRESLLMAMAVEMGRKLMTLASRLAEFQKPRNDTKARNDTLGSRIE